MPATVYVANVPVLDPIGFDFTSLFQGLFLIIFPFSSLEAACVKARSIVWGLL